MKQKTAAPTATVVTPVRPDLPPTPPPMPPFPVAPKTNDPVAHQKYKKEYDAYSHW